jgi:hypothetical protein
MAVKSEKLTTPYSNRTRLKQAIGAISIFVPYCFGPAALLTMASIIFIIGNTCTFAQFTSPVLNLNNLLIAMVTLLGSFAVGIVLLIISFSKWIFVLLTFCRFWLSLPSQSTEVIDLRVVQQQAITDIKNRQKSLARFWLFALLLMLLPILIFCLAVGLKLASLSAIFGAQAIRLPGPVDFILLPLSILLGVCLTIISLMTVPVAAMSKVGATETVKQTFILSWKKFPQAAVLSVVILLLNTAIASPQLFTKYATFESYLLPSLNLPLALIEQIWQGLVSIILFPLSLIPFCELLRSSIVDLVQTK